MRVGTEAPLDSRALAIQERDRARGNCGDIFEAEDRKKTFTLQGCHLNPVRSQYRRGKGHQESFGVPCDRRC